MNGTSKYNPANIQNTHFKIIFNIVGHPEQMPSLQELSYHIPSLSSSTIREHLEILESDGVIEFMILPEDERKRDLPYTFYTLTKKGKSLVADSKCFPDISYIKDTYQIVKKSKRIEKYENSPRPN